MEQKRRFGIFTQFFLWCSGTDIATLETCNSLDDNKYTGMGAAVCLTSLLALASGSFAMSYYSDNGGFQLTYLIPASLYALFIFNMDRYFIASITKTDVFWTDFKRALPRFCLAFLFSYLVATPVELQLFHKEIESRGLPMLKESKLIKQQDNIKKMDDSTAAIDAKNRELLTPESINPTLKNAIARAQTAKDAYDEAKKRERSEIQRLRKDANEALSKANVNINMAAQGRGNTQDLPLFRAQKQRVETTLKNLRIRENNIEQKVKPEKDKLEEVEKEESDIRADTKSTIEDIRKTNSDKRSDAQKEKERLQGEQQNVRQNYEGLAARHEALLMLAFSDWSMFIWWFVITLVFLGIEMSPLLYKLMTPRGEYDFKKEDQRAQAEKISKAFQASLLTSNFKPGQYHIPNNAFINSSDGTIQIGWMKAYWYESTEDLKIRFKLGKVVEFYLLDSIKYGTWEVDFKNGKQLQKDDTFKIKVGGNTYEWLVLSITDDELTFDNTTHSQILYFKREQ